MGLAIGLGPTSADGDRSARNSALGVVLVGLTGALRSSHAAASVARDTTVSVSDLRIDILLIRVAPATRPVAAPRRRGMSFDRVPRSTSARPANSHSRTRTARRCRVFRVTDGLECVMRRTRVCAHELDRCSLCNSGVDHRNSLFARGVSRAASARILERAHTTVSQETPMRSQLPASLDSARAARVRHHVVTSAAMIVLGASVFGCGESSTSGPSAPSAPDATQVDRARAVDTRHFLIADQFNNRVIEVDAQGAVLWHFGGGPNNVSATAIVGVNDAQRVGDLTLMAGTGAPAGTEPLCPDGCPDNRVMLVNRAGTVVWQYGTFGVTGDGPNELDAPVQSTYLPSGHVLITDQGNQRVIEVERVHNSIVWQ